MSTSVKLDQQDKEKLDKLQALVTLKRGKKVTQQELLSTLITDAFERGDELLEKVLKKGIPLSDEEYGKILSLVDDWGVETRWEDIDRTLYGAPKRRK